LAQNVGTVSPAARQNQLTDCNLLCGDSLFCAVGLLGLRVRYELSCTFTVVSGIRTQLALISRCLPEFLRNINNSQMERKREENIPELLTHRYV